MVDRSAARKCLHPGGYGPLQHASLPREIGGWPTSLGLLLAGGEERWRCRIFLLRTSILRVCVYGAVVGAFEITVLYSVETRSENGRATAVFSSATINTVVLCAVCGVALGG